MNCTQVCHGRLVYKGKTVKPAEWNCDMEENSSNPLASMGADEMREIVTAIASRDHLGYDVEQHKPMCNPENDNTHDFWFAPMHTRFSEATTSTDT